jgi:hypothetical protein
MFQGKHCLHLHDQRISSASHLLSCSFLACHILWLWSYRKHVPPKRGAPFCWFIRLAELRWKYLKPSAWGYNWAILFWGEYKYRDLAFQIGRSPKFETVMYGHGPCGTWNLEWLRWWEPATVVNYRLVPSSESAPHINKSTSMWQ